MRSMRRWDPLNSRQLVVLQRIAGGDDLSNPADNSARTSAAALRDRGLLNISRRGGQWKASLTEDGQFYLDHGCHPDHPSAPTAPSGGDEHSTLRRRNPTHDRRSSRVAPRALPSTRLPRADAAKVATERRAAATDLVAKLVAKRLLRIAEPGEDAMAEWLRVIDFARRHKLLPAGTRIVKLRVNDGDLGLELVKGVHANSRRSTPGGLPAVPVPTELRSLHPVVAALQDDDCSCCTG